MNVVFRADASVVIGSGHVMRCLTLARALRDRGCDVRFILREHRGAPTELLAGEGFPLTLLPAPATEPGPDEDYAAWLGVPPAVDAAETVSALKGFEPELLVVDHYALGSEWERAVKAHVSRLMVIDDLANRLHDCDLLLDQNFSAQPESRYRGLVPPQCISLIGPRYALLRPEYRAHRKSASRPLAPPSRILVFFGGSDLHGLTGVALDALSRPDLAHFAADVVVTKNYGGVRRLEEQAAARPRTTLHGSRPHLADLMAGADLAIGSGGATTWERMCIGLPSIVVAAAENQRPSAEALARAGLICYAGKWADASAASLYRMTLDLASDQDRLENLRQRNQVEVDGIGTMRVVEALIPTSSDALRLRNARAEDVSLFFSWANERSVRDNAINTAAIDWGSHQDWFARKLADPIP